MKTLNNVSMRQRPKNVAKSMSGKVARAGKNQLQETTVPAGYAKDPHYSVPLPSQLYTSYLGSDYLGYHVLKV